MIEAMFRGARPLEHIRPEQILHIQHILPIVYLRLPLHPRTIPSFKDAHGIRPNRSFSRRHESNENAMTTNRKKENNRDLTQEVRLRKKKSHLRNFLFFRLLASSMRNCASAEAIGMGGPGHYSDIVNFLAVF